MDVITGEFKDLASCTAMSLSKSGKLAFIAGRRAYGLVDLDNPQVGVRVACQNAFFNR